MRRIFLFTAALIMMMCSTVGARDSQAVLNLATNAAVDQVDSVLRDFNGGSCTIDVGTDLSPQQLYQMLKATNGGLTISLKGFLGNTLEIGVA